MATPSVNDFFAKLKDAGNALSDQGVGPLNARNAWKSAVDVFRSTTEVLGLGVVVQKFLDSIESLFTGGGPSAPAANPIDPAQAVKDLARALTAAEQQLNQENLIIVAGTVDVTLSANVGGVAGANAQIHLEIAPRNS